jgi:23S rRNA (guanosine2251-2'-O)-methyltransferase
VRELLAAGRRHVREVWIADSEEMVGLNSEIEALAGNRRVPVRLVGSGRLRSAARTEVPQGVIAFAEPVVPVDLDELMPAGGGKSPALLVVLDGVTDPHNLGAVLRVAECAGASGVVIPRHRASHLTPAACKAAAGAVERLRMAVVPGIPSALQELSRLGCWSIGLDAKAPTELFGLDLTTMPVALALGSEGRGLSRLARERCDVLARLPLAGSVGSLNVSTAAAVACYEVFRQRSRPA